MIEIVLLPATTADFQSAFNWFEGLKAGLGSAFESEFFAALERVKSNPELFAETASGYRACRLKRFSAVLYYRISVNAVVITGLFVNGRDDATLADRE